MRMAGRSKPGEGISGMSVQGEKTHMRRLMPLPAVAGLVLSTATALADLGDQLAKLLPDDGAEGDIFGVSVAIGGATAIAGAFLDDGNGTNSGSAYRSDTTTGQQAPQLDRRRPVAELWADITGCLCPRPLHPADCEVPAVNHTKARLCLHHNAIATRLSQSSVVSYQYSVPATDN